MNIYIKKYNIYFIIYIILGIFGFYTLGLPSLNGTISIQTYSDSLTYEYVARHLYDKLPMFSMSSNLFGPVMLLKVTSYNYLVIFIFNTIVFIYSLKLILKTYFLNHRIFLFFLLLSPLSFFSLFNVNKEIFVFLSTAFFISFISKRNKKYILLAFITSLFVRWQLGLFYIVYYIIDLLPKRKKERIIYLFFIILLLSIIYPVLAKSLFSKVVDHATINRDIIHGSGIFTTLNAVQARVGGYILVWIPKFFQINFGLVKRINMLGYTKDFWNYFVLLLHSLMSLLLFLFLLYRKRLNLSNDLVFASLLYISIFTVTPITNIRYFLPIYIMFSIVVSEQLGQNDDK